MSTNEREQAPRGGWDGFLAALGSSKEAAKRRYHELRGRLIRLFEIRGLSACEDLADETLERVANKLAAGEIVHAEDPTRFVCGVARLVAFEARRRQGRTRPLPESDILATPPPRDREVDRLHACLDHCMAELDAESRGHLLEYHSGDGQARIAGRKRMAERLGVSLNQLRVRLHRLRGELERCLDTCLSSPRGRE